MNLFDPARPKTEGERPALLLDGGPVPQISVTPQAPGVLSVYVMLRSEQYDSFAYKRTNLAVTELAAFMIDFEADPEATILRHFRWLDKAPFRAPIPKPVRMAPTAPSAELIDALELI